MIAHVAGSPNVVAIESRSISTSLWLNSKFPKRLTFRQATGDIPFRSSIAARSPAVSF